MAVADLLDAFASNDPVPGGGSAAALAGALGASLLLMVAGMTKTKTGTPEEAADLAEAAARLRPLRESLVALIDRDSDAYQQVVSAFKLPKATAAEQAAGRDAIQSGTRAAIDAPLETMRLCRQALDLAATVRANGNPNAASDVSVAVELLTAASHGARFNVDVNLSAVTDAATAERYRAEMTRLSM